MRKSWKSQPGFARGVRTDGEDGDHLCSREGRRVEVAQGEHRTARGEEPEARWMDCAQEEHHVEGGGRTRSW